jgi:hypothetical protein
VRRMGQFEMSGPKPEDENDTGEDEPEDKPVVEEKARSGYRWRMPGDTYTIAPQNGVDSG